MPSPRPKVVVVGDYAPDNITSIRLYVEALSSGVRDLGFDVYPIAPKEVFGGPGKSRLLGFIDKGLLFRRHLRSLLRSIDATPEDTLVHIGDNCNAFYLTDRFIRNRARTVVTCHDFFALDKAFGGDKPDSLQLGFFGRRRQVMNVKGLHVADHFICISSATANTLERVVPGKKASTTIVYNSLRRPFARIPSDTANARLSKHCPELLQHPHGFFLTIGHDSWYKNRPFILRSYFNYCHATQNPAALAFVGGAFGPEMQALAETAPANATIIRLGKISDDELIALQSLAKGLFFPSLAEGFGWPVVEAMACGCPVLTSDRNPMAEIAGGAALLVSPENETEAAKALEKLATDPDARERLSLAGLQRALAFAPSNMIAGTAAVYQKVLTSPRLNR